MYSEKDSIVNAVSVVVSGESLIVECAGISWGPTILQAPRLSERKIGGGHVPAILLKAV